MGTNQLSSIFHVISPETLPKTFLSKFQVESISGTKDSKIVEFGGVIRVHHKQKPEKKTVIRFFLASFQRIEQLFAKKKNSLRVKMLTPPLPWNFEKAEISMGGMKRIFWFTPSV